MFSQVFNTKNLLVNEQMNYVNVLESTMDTDTDHSFFIESLNFLVEMKEEYNTHNKKFYKTILESQGEFSIINEGFNEFFNMIKSIIEKIINFVKKLFNRFITLIMGMVSSEKYIRRNKDYLSKFDSKYNFNYDGFKFTFSGNVPSLSALTTFNKSFDELKLEEKNDNDNLSSLMGSAKEADTSKAANALRQKYDELLDNLQDNIYDVYRGQTIGTSESISQSEYAEELFKIFRDGETRKSKIEINSSKVMECYDRFDKYEKTTDKVKKDKNQIEKDYTNLKKKIESSLKREANGVHVFTHKDSDKLNIADKDVINTLDLFVKAKANEIQELSNIHIMAFSAKLDAMRDCFKQDKNILYKALGKIQGDVLIPGKERR